MKQKEAFIVGMLVVVERALQPAQFVRVCRAGSTFFEGMLLPAHAPCVKHYDTPGVSYRPANPGEVWSVWSATMQALPSPNRHDINPSHLLFGDVVVHQTKQGITYVRFEHKQGDVFHGTVLSPDGLTTAWIDSPENEGRYKKLSPIEASMVQALHISQDLKSKQNTSTSQECQQTNWFKDLQGSKDQPVATMKKEEFKSGQGVIWSEGANASYILVLGLMDIHFRAEIMGTLGKTVFKEGDVVNLTYTPKSGFYQPMPEKLFKQWMKVLTRRCDKKQEAKKPQESQPEEQLVIPEVVVAPCALCSAFVGASVSHEDPCQYSYMERSMYPIAKSLYRKQREQESKREIDEADSKKRMAALAHVEAPHHLPDHIRAYRALTGS